MYKVFVNNKPCCLANEAAPSSNYSVMDLKKLKLNQLLEEVSKSSCNGVWIRVDDEEVAWQKFKNFFTYVEAAGGLVKDNQKELYLLRFGMWDLPKGHEKGESQRKLQSERLRKKQV